MTIDSEKNRRDANRRNAQASTGPRSKRGKARVRRNALKHGLAAEPLTHKFPPRRIGSLVVAVCGGSAEPAYRKAAVKFVIAHLYCLKVVAVRQKILNGKLRDLRGNATPSVFENHNQTIILSLLANDPELVAIERYERRAFGRRRRAFLGLHLFGQ